MGHDQRFKEFLQTFMRDFLQLFFPDVERRLDFGNIEFLDKEVFTDFSEGSSRRADVVAKLATHDGEPEIVLIHIEVQSEREKEFPARMFGYYALLRARHKIPVFPIVVYLYGGREGHEGLTTEEYRIHLFEDEILRLWYRCVQLARLDVEEYRRGVGPVGAALGALMDSSRTPERAELRVSLLLQVIESGPVPMMMRRARASSATSSRTTSSSRPRSGNATGGWSRERRIAKCKMLSWTGWTRRS